MLRYGVCSLCSFAKLCTVSPVDESIAATSNETLSLHPQDGGSRAETSSLTC